MKKILLLLIAVSPLCLPAQRLAYKDFLYLYMHDKEDCNSYLRARNFYPDEPDYSTDENGCRRYTGVYDNGGEPLNIRILVKLCPDAASGHIRYTTFSRSEYDNLQAEFRRNGFDYEYYNDLGGDDRAYIYSDHEGWIGWFSIHPNDIGTLYIIGIENVYN